MRKLNNKSILKITQLKTELGYKTERHTMDTLEEAVEYINGSTTKSPQAVKITFDDFESVEITDVDELIAPEKSGLKNIEQITEEYRVEFVKIITEFLKEGYGCGDYTMHYYREIEEVCNELCIDTKSIEEDMQKAAEQVEEKLVREKIAVGYFQKGYGKGKNTRAIVYLIDGKLYAKDKKGWESMYTPLSGKFEGYVPVNNGGDGFYFQCSNIDGLQEHMDYKKNIEA